MAAFNLSQLCSNQYILLLITLWTIYSSPLVDCAVSGAESYHLLSVQSLLPEQECTSFGETDPSKLKIVNRHGPCSPINHGPKPTPIIILEADRIRAHYLNSKSAIPTSQIPAKDGKSLSSGNYIVQISLGTPKIPQSVDFDTGSDTTWVQCQPCLSRCYYQQDRIFDPSQSSTYSNISCTSPSCTSLYGHLCSASTCIYRILYGDNSHTAGFYAQDTLTLSPSDVIPNFLFGCGQENVGLFGRTAGLLGLGREPSSLVVQTMSKYGGVFAYCLPAVSSSAGYLTFGRSNVAGSNVQYTPMLSRVEAQHYYLELLSMSVGGRALDVSSTAFSRAGVIIDSGTVITRMPPTAYAQLRSAFASGMTRYPRVEGDGLLDLCYDLSGYSYAPIPAVGMSFRGATVNLDPSGILFVLRANEQVCLGFAPNKNDGDIMIIGNNLQKRFNVVYDLARNVVGFGAKAC